LIGEIVRLAALALALELLRCWRDIPSNPASRSRPAAAKLQTPYAAWVPD
jgi:hypothetical protein